MLRSPLKSDVDAETPPSMQLTSAQIGRSGELLVQYRLLCLGIESSPMSTDAGIDLVAYSPEQSKARTVQVKTNLKPKPGGGKGKEVLDWWIPDDSPAELIALVDLSEQRIWIFTMPEVATSAQQHPKGRYHLFMYVDPTYAPKTVGRIAHAFEFQRFLLENRSHSLFGV
jgi:hypothetical protein